MKGSRMLAGGAVLLSVLLSACAVSAGDASLPQASAGGGTEAVSATVSAPSEEEAPVSSDPSEEAPAEEDPDAPEEDPEDDESTGKYITFMCAEVDISDEDVQKAGGLPEENQCFVIHSEEELRAFAEKYEETYFLSHVDAGETFAQASADMNEGFFESNNVVITAQRYKKSDGITLWEVYEGGGCTMIDIYKNEPADEREAGYILYLVSGSKKRMGLNGVTLNFFPAGSYLSEESEE